MINEKENIKKWAEYIEERCQELGFEVLSSNYHYASHKVKLTDEFEFIVYTFEEYLVISLKVINGRTAHQLLISFTEKENDIKICIEKLFKKIEI